MELTAPCRCVQVSCVACCEESIRAPSVSLRPVANNNTLLQLRVIQPWGHTCSGHVSCAQIVYRCPNIRESKAESHVQWDLRILCAIEVRNWDTSHLCVWLF
jgi:hypothetical protein